MVKRINYLIVGSLLLSSAVYADPFNGAYIGITGGYTQALVGGSITTTPPGGVPNKTSSSISSYGGNIGGLYGFGFDMGAYYLGGEFDATKFLMSNNYNTLNVQEPKPFANIGVSFLPGLFLTPNLLLFARFGVEGVNYNQYVQNANGSFYENNRSDSINLEGGLGVTVAMSEHFLLRSEVDVAPAVIPIDMNRNYTVNGLSVHENAWPGYGQVELSALYKF